MKHDPHAPPAGGSDDRRPYLPAEKEYYRKPVDSAQLPNHLGRLLDILLTLRWRAGESERIDPTTAELAVLYGCCKGHMRRLLQALATQYDGIVYEYPTSTYRVIRFLYKLKGQRDFEPQPGLGDRNDSNRRAARDRGRRAAGDKQAPQSSDPPSTDVISGAPNPVTSGAPSILIENLREENSTLRERDLDPLNTDSVSVVAPPMESEAQRNGRIKADFILATDSERKAIEAEVRSANPALVRNKAWIESLSLAAFERAHQDRYPAIIAATAPPSKPSPPTGAGTLTEQILRLADPTGTQAVFALAERLAEQLDDVHSLDLHCGILDDVASGMLSATYVAKVYKLAREQTRKPPRVYAGLAFKALREKQKTARRVAVRSYSANGPKCVTH